MSQETPKPRELWILTAAAHLPINVVDSQMKAEEIIGMTKRSNDPSAIHVVEYSALEAANAEIERHKDLLRKQCNHSQDLQSEIENLNDTIKSLNEGHRKLGEESAARISELEAEMDLWRKESILREDYDKLREQARILREALETYGNKKSWAYSSLKLEDLEIIDGEWTGGRKARESLKATEGVK